jgi:hypothetical protein
MGVCVYGSVKSVFMEPKPPLYVAYINPLLTIPDEEESDLSPHENVGIAKEGDPIDSFKEADDED